MKPNYICPNCETDSKTIHKPVFSMKFKSFFCDQECYEEHRKKLDASWDDKPVQEIVVAMGEDSK